MKNAQLWKRILNEKIHIDGVLTDGSEEWLRTKIITSPLIVGPMVDVDAVSKEVINWERFASVAMPFSEFWFEQPASDGSSLGQMVGVANNGDLRSICSYSIGAAKQVPGLHMLFAAAWNMTHDGYPAMDSNKGLPIHCVANRYIRDALQYEAFKSHMYTAVDSLLGVLQIMSARNISMAENDIEQKQAQRAAKRYGGTPEDYRYHTLVVRPPGAGPHTKGEPLSIMPRHVCRGHFSEYGPEFGKGLLFGKYAGRFYVPPHIKGDNKNGTVEKDYVIP